MQREADILGFELTPSELEPAGTESTYCAGPFDDLTVRYEIVRAAAI